MHQVVCCVSNTRPAQPNQFQSSANGHLPPNNIAKSVQNRLVAAASAPPVPQRSFQNQGSLDTKQSSLFGNDAKQVVRQPWTFTSPLNNTLETEYKEFLIQFVKNPTVGIALPSVWLMAAELENEFYDYLNDLNIRYEQGDCLKEKTIYQAKLGDLVIAPYDGDYYRCEVIHFQS